MKFTPLQSDILYRGRVFTLRQDTVRLPDGGRTQFDILQHNGGVAVVPLDADGNVWLVRQYRQAAGRLLLEIPAGTLEEGESPEENAHRELQEEIGMNARHITPIGSFFLAPGYSTEYMHLFLARDLFPARLPADDDEFIEVVRMPFEEALALISEGAFQDAKTILGLLWTQQMLSAPGSR